MISSALFGGTKGRMMIDALMDRSVFALARLFESTSKKSPSVTNKLAGIVRTKRRWDETGSKERAAILELARAAKAEKIKLFTSRIAFDEGVRVQLWPDLTSELDIFANLNVPEFEWIELPFDFAKVPGFYGNDLSDVARYKDALALIVSPLWVQRALQNPSALKFTDREMRNIRDTADILKLAAPKNDHLVDIFQLWTAHVNELPYFITCDGTFIRYMTQTHKNPFSSQPILPSDICKKLSILFRPLKPPHRGDFYTYGESPLTRLIEAHDKGEPPPRARSTQYD